MRCLCCNVILTSFEATRKYEESKEFVDLCNRCFKGLGIVATEREDLRNEADFDYMPEMSEDDIEPDRTDE
jgi:hypothetical protein